jgi:glycosyltransferase involved in cell wall biosynthesis
VKAKPRILFVSHSASRNGASLVLLHFLQWLKTTHKWQIDILVDGGGPLLNAFKAVGRTRVWRNPSVLLKPLPKRWRQALQPYVDRLYVRTLLGGRRFDLIYANTAATWRQVAALNPASTPVVWHIHELSYSLALSMPGVRASDALRTATQVIAVSGSVRDTLVREYQVCPDRIDVIHPFVRVPPLDAADRFRRRAQVLDMLGWPSDAFVIGACGGPGWRKGSDLFLQVARNMCKRSDIGPFRFLWVGGEMNDRVAREFDHDVRSASLTDCCARVPTTSDVLDYFAAMDVFALTSREDPFPLVMLEAGACRVPTVCFEGSGGGPEFVESDAGLAAPYLDVAAFGEQLLKLYKDRDLTTRLGTAAAAKVHGCFTVDTQGPKLASALRASLDRAASLADALPAGSAAAIELENHNL